ncbi:hypothetical protein SK854_32860 [Lentzea sp. BCCO 10_0061]|uniref:Uncharacterized protein n=1 Tax=Lentzea sokolovensis TaxID=3095429 RepID=A0ABU4V584_9PSEU|nr:hypothetical protein [Lentzea sp. BCCO 10_0061]MDX8146946.1 hypothetical protein [Lentzea sp. BCCO 10_0061]
MSKKLIAGGVAGAAVFAAIWATGLASAEESGAPAVTADHNTVFTQDPPGDSSLGRPTKDNVPAK